MIESSLNKGQIKLKMITRISFFFLIIILQGSPALAENSQKKQGQLQQQINTASNTLKNSKAVSSKLRKKVRVAEDKLSAISRNLHDTERDINRLTTKLTKSNAQKAKLEKQTEQQRNALTQQMQALYTSGKQSHLRLLLKQDDPSDISRTVKYFEYLNKHRLKRIKSINKRLLKIKQVQDQISKDTTHLKKLQKEQSSKKRSLKAAVNAKELSLKKQRKVVLSDQQKLQKLRKEESRLMTVIERLAAKERKERLQREAQILAAKKAKEREKQIKKDAQASKKSKTISKKVATIKRHYVPNKPFSSLRGKLSWPVRGKISHKFGSIRNTLGMKWKGVFISAPGGANIHAVARGKVEYSGRLNGYGYVVIIRHDKSYRSIYGYNRSVFKKEGQIVKAGEIIAAVGNTGRQANTGLYFEISKGATKQNPARWCR